MEENNRDKDSNSLFPNSPSNDLNAQSQQNNAKEKFTMGGVKKPKFRPVMTKAASVHKLDKSPIPLVSTTPIPIITKEEKPSEVVQTDKKMEIEEEPSKPKEVKKKEKVKKEPESKPRQPRVNQPRSLISGESKFFATNASRGSAGSMDTALLLSRQAASKKTIKTEDGMEIEEELNDDHELTAENNGPIRFPYIQDLQPPVDSSSHSWDEDDAQVTPLELLRGVKDGELLLFALPSFLPIYKKNKEYGIDEGAYAHVLDTKPRDYVENELREIQPGKIGKMRVHESGRITIDVNGYVVDMNVSIPLRYQQEVVTIDDQGLNILGNVSHRLLLSPSIENFGH